MRTTFMKRAGAAIALAIIAGFVALNPDHGQTAAPIQERIVYEGEDGIMSVTPEGENPILIAPYENSERQPRISPDGTKIVLVRGQLPETDIWVMNADGTNKVNLTNDTAQDGDPTWSPHGTKIAFWSQRSGDNNIWVMDIDGANPVNLTNSTWVEYQPAWSPDGGTIAYSRQGVVGTSAPFHLWSVDSSGGIPADLTPAYPDNIYYPEYSPDGTNIVVSVRPATQGEDGKRIFEIDTGSGQMTQRTIEQGDVPRYSPDGTSIVFHSKRDAGEYRMYIVDESGTETRVLEEYARHPDWGATGGAGPGDVDGDGTIDVQDARMAVQFIAGGDRISYPQFADMDCDGDVDIRDVLWMLRQIGGLAIPGC